MSKGTALITGASTGIGEALAREFAGNDYDLIITARNRARLENLAAELGDFVHVDIVVCDLFEAQGPQELMDAVTQLGKTVDVLVNNAGMAPSGRFHDMDASQVENLMALNVRAVTLLTHHFLPLMIAQGAGRILNVASVASFQPIPHMSAYAASKSFVLSLTEGISQEIQGTGVSVTALCPGITRPENVADDMDLPGFLVSTPEEVAEQGYEALMAREVVRIPGAANQAAVTWSRLHPRWLVRGLGGLVSRLVPEGHKENRL